MYNILFISNDIRVGGLISYLQPLLKGAIHCTSDFDQGLKDIFDKRPALVFIQRKINNVSGDVVAQHIKGLLRDNRPRLVLLQDHGDVDPNVATTYDDNIGFVLPEPDIYKHFYTYLKKYPEIPWADDQSEHGAAEKSAGQGGAAPEASVSATGVASKASPAAPDKRSPAGATPQAKTASPPRKAGGTAQFAASSPTKPQAAKKSPDKPPFQTMPAKGTSKGRVVLLLALLLGLGAYALYTQGLIPKTTFDRLASGSSSPIPSGSRESVDVHLPAVVVMNTADPSYSTANPGWERYGGERVDFRVFREKGRIKVIQGICRGEGGLGNDFIAAFLADILGNSQYSITSTSAKNGFLVERGSATSKAEIIVYRQEKTKAVKGFVVSIS